MPQVSVIVPVRNGGQNLRQCLQSITDQTLRDVEIIIVDDGSTDESAAIVTEFAARDPRVSCVPGPATGSAGSARNVGLAMATGDYLAFLDADDYFAPTMLEELHTQASLDRADVALCKFRVHNEQTGDSQAADWAMRLQYFPKKMPFAPDDLGDYLFFAVNPAAWNKLFRASFIRKAKLEFQDLRRTNDAYFTYMALAQAKRITHVDRYLVNYRSGNPYSLQGSNQESPLEFVEAIAAMRRRLEEIGKYQKLERAFVNEALELCLANLRRASTLSAFQQIHRALTTDVFARFGILNRPASYFVRPSLARQLDAIQNHTAEEYLFRRFAEASDAAAQARAEARSALREIEVRANATWLASQPEPPQPRSLPERRRIEPSAARPDVSVIIPVYNTEGYIAECVDSVRAQTGVELQIICIDDGSTDTSGELLDRFAAEDERIIVIHQPNAGLSGARNTGLAHATGRYVCFIDSDDYWRENALARMVRRADENKLDALLFDAVPLREQGVSDKVWARYEHYYRRSDKFGTVMTGPELLARMKSIDEYRASACLYLVRSGLVRELGLVFYPGITHEDNLFTFALMLEAKRATHLAEPMYARRIRPGSIMTAGERAASTRGYLVTYLEMRRLASRGNYEDWVAEQIGAVIFTAFRMARDNFIRLDPDIGDRLREVDPSPEAQAAFHMLRRLRYEWRVSRANKPNPKPRKSLPRRLLQRARRLAKRVLGRQ